MATSKALRAAPDKNLNSYIASIRRLNNNVPVTIPDNSFSDQDFISDGSSTASTSFLASREIGFSINLNEVSYTRFSISENGWMFLQDPSGTPAVTDVTAASLYNYRLKDTFTQNHILLAPWWDYSVVPTKTVSPLTTSEYSGTITPDIENDIAEGKNTKNWPFDLKDRGARFKNTHDPKLGKCLLVRWTVSQQYFGDKLKYEVALFENGRIEFRYWPLEVYQRGWSDPNPSLAAVGVFWNGAGTANQFRDFAPLLGYSRGERSISDLGGASYDASYSETTSGIYTTYSSHKIKYWPIDGAVITFSPPTRSLKALPRKMSSLIGTNRPAVPSPGLFDDRKTVNFKEDVQIHLPSGMSSRLIGDSGDVDISSRQLLFTSGSIIVTGNVTKSNVDKNLEQLSLLDVQQRDLSFNESKFNNLTETTSTFYATGSSLERFGEGFTSPLKSKTQFSLSFPVTKQVTMPPTVPSFYYYDQKRLSWTMMDPDGYRSPAPMPCYNTGATPDEFGITSARGHIHRVVETSRGFDAVGRKIVSGSNNINYTLSIGATDTYQSDNRIGAIFNYEENKPPPAGVEVLGQNFDITTNAYANSLTDNPSFYPQGSQQLSLPIDYPFLIEKVVVDIPLYIEGGWFEDRTTCTRAYIAKAASPPAYGFGYPSGAIDFGGPGLTFGIVCPKKVLNSSYVDLIVSGTITHQFDDISSVELTKESSGQAYYSMRPVGFRSFSNPTAVVSGTFDGANYVYDGSVRLEMEASVAGGLTLARNDRSLLTKTADYITVNRQTAVNLLTSEAFLTRGEKNYNTYDNNPTVFAQYTLKSPRIYIQQVSPLSRGTSKLEFNGNSLLGSSVSSFKIPKTVDNPLYVSTSGSLPSELKNKIDSADFKFEAVSIYSVVNSLPSPYLMMPGEKLSILFSKTRPVIRRVSGTYYDNALYTGYALTGSHGTVMLNTGSINVTVYGSYVKEGMEYHE